jgi:hypothetical protein
MGAWRQKTPTVTGASHDGSRMAFYKQAGGNLIRQIFISATTPFSIQAGNN